MRRRSRRDPPVTPQELARLLERAGHPYWAWGPPALAQDPTKAPWAKVPPGLRDDLLAFQYLRTIPKWQVYERHCLLLWEAIARRVTAAPWESLPHGTLTVLALTGEDVGLAVRSFLGLAPPDAKPPLVLLAYLGRAARRPDVRLSAIAREMALVWLWLLAEWEFRLRISRHPMGARLWAAATSAGTTPPRMLPWAAGARGAIARWAPKEWIRRAARPIAGSDREDDRAVVEWRLTKEIERLRHESPDVLAAKAMEGLLNYHKSAVKQALVDEYRKPWRRERLVFEDDLDRLDRAPELDRHRIRFHTEPGDKNEPSGQPEVGTRKGAVRRPEESIAGFVAGPGETRKWDPDQVADEIAHLYRTEQGDQLTRGERRMLRVRCRNPEKPWTAIAKEAGGGNSTASRLHLKLRRMNRRTLKRLLLS